jgi:hypothetical protein
LYLPGERPFDEGDLAHVVEGVVDDAVEEDFEGEVAAGDGLAEAGFVAMDDELAGLLDDAADFAAGFFPRGGVGFGGDGGPVAVGIR